MNPIKSILKAVIPKKAREALRESAKRLAHAGGPFECVYCGSSVKDWAPRGVQSEVIERLDIVPTGYRMATCPFCQSYDRDRLLFLFLKSKTTLFSKPIRLLHIAPELTLAGKIVECPTIDYLSGDIDGHLAMQAMDVTNLKLDTGSFDAVICNHVLEHVPDDRRAMSELLRVLKPGGWAVLQVPIATKLDATIEDPSAASDEERLARFGQIDHVRVYAMADYLSRLDESGWDVEVIDFSAELGEAAVRKFGLHPRERIVFCRKPMA
jgi:SAM-dependent methyltransferase